jgi:hypothetical protein
MHRQPSLGENYVFCDCLATAVKIPTTLIFRCTPIGKTISAKAFSHGSHNPPVHGTFVSFALPATSPVGNFLLSHLESVGWTVFASTPAQTVIELPDTWDDYS